MSVYTKQYFTITREGHTRPTPSFGGGTVIWHIAMWPARPVDPQHVTMLHSGTVMTSSASLARFDDNRRRLLRAINHELGLLQTKGRNPAAGVPEQFRLIPPPEWDQATPPRSDQEIYEADSLGFTLWWHDREGIRMDARAPNAKPFPQDIRVRVHVEAHPDFFSLSFFVDPGTMWTDPLEGTTFRPIHADAPNIPGKRREDLFDRLQNVRKICEPRLDGPLIERDLLPEEILNVEADHTRLHEASDKASELKAAADFFYDDIWKAFCRDFDFSLERLVRPVTCPPTRGVDNGVAKGDGTSKTDENLLRVFADFRGFVLPTRGAGQAMDLEMQDKIVSSDPALAASPGLMAYQRFRGDGLKEEKFKGQGTEANAVVKAFWPFIRRITPEADFRDYVVSGILDWRMLYVTALGSQSEYDAGDEGALISEASAADVQNPHPADTPAGHLPKKLLIGDLAAERTLSAHRVQKEASLVDHTGAVATPIRYLFLTKNEPHRRQIGRIVERINSIGTMRLFTLKNWTIIREASTHVRVRGQELDAITAWRNDRIKALNPIALFARHEDSIKEYNDALDQLDRLDEVRGRRKLSLWERRKHERERKRIDGIVREKERLVKRVRRERAAYDASLAAINRETDTKLLEINSALDNLGSDAIGGLPYRINRARYYADLFRTLVATLRPGNVETWVAYNQFVTRGLEPALRFIDGVGTRLEGLRRRLQSAMQGIQTSAIVNQTEARDTTRMS